MHVSDLDYDLPQDAIAQTPAEPRDAARLLVTDTLADHEFGDLPSLLDPGDLVVVNRTRVRAARITGRRRDSGGSVELLLLRPLASHTWEAMARPSRRLRSGVRIDFEGVAATVVSDPTDGIVQVRLEHEGDIDDVLGRIGTVPLPPYFTGSLSSPERYQTIFAKSVGSAAAPTAALHFTPRVVQEIGERGVAMTEVELDVGLDTFRPIASRDTGDHVIHRERFEVPEAAWDAVQATRVRGHRVIAVGTTVVRALETAAIRWGGPGSGESDLFITPGHRFAVVDGLLTNFHAPRTTLIALVAAALGQRWRHVYESALDRGYRFLSFGDAMLVPRIPPS